MLKNKMYADYKKCLDIHGTVLYPAVMIAPVQKDILEELRYLAMRSIQLLIHSVVPVLLYMKRLK